MPVRAALSAYVGPMPLPVVPMAFVPSRLLGKHVKNNMVRHDDVCAVTDDKPAVNVDTPLTETVYLVEQHIRINDYSVANDIDCLWPEYATRDQMEAEPAILVDHSMSALFPPENRATMSASRANTSIILPFPSSPH